MIEPRPFEACRTRSCSCEELRRQKRRLIEHAKVCLCNELDETGLGYLMHHVWVAENASGHKTQCLVSIKCHEYYLKCNYPVITEMALP